MALTSKIDTNWTHFGGVAPAEELDILRGQLFQLHNQLLFERHRRDLHGQRNRRLLRRAIQSVAMEENVNAMVGHRALQRRKCTIHSFIHSLLWGFVFFLLSLFLLKT